LQHYRNTIMPRWIEYSLKIWIDNSSSGHVWTRSDVLGRPVRAASSPPIELARHLEGTRVRVYGDVGVVTGRVITLRTGLPGEKAHVEQTLFTDVLVWRDGRWQAISSQETAVPEVGTPPPGKCWIGTRLMAIGHQRRQTLVRFPRAGSFWAGDDKPGAVNRK
jgi:hypothetical protein